MMHIFSRLLASDTCFSYCSYRINGVTVCEPELDQTKDFKIRIR